MKYLIVICLTAIAITFFHESGKSYQEQIRSDARARVLMFHTYSDLRRAEPKVECPTSKGRTGSDKTSPVPELQKEKL